MARFKRRTQLRNDRLAARFVDPNGLCNGGGRQARIADCRQRHDDDSVAEPLTYSINHGQRQARLAHAAWTGHGNQPRIGEQFDDLRDLTLATNEAGRGVVRLGNAASAIVVDVRRVEQCAFIIAPHDQPQGRAVSQRRHSGNRNATADHARHRTGQRDGRQPVRYGWDADDPARSIRAGSPDTCLGGAYVMAYGVDFPRSRSSLCA